MNGENIMRALVDKHDLGLIEGCHPHTIERRRSQRDDFPKPVTGDNKTNARVQWFCEDIIAWYEKHPEVLLHARVIVEHVLSQPRWKRGQPSGAR